MNNQVLIGAVIAALAVGCILLQLFSGKGKFRQKEFMTPNEREFYGRLIAALPEHFVFPQVAMSAIIEPLAHSKSDKQTDRNKISQKIIDYVVCDSTCKVILVIELDDRTHIPEKDKLRDAMLRTAKVETLRFDSRKKPSLVEIQSAVQRLLDATSPQQLPA